MREAVRKWPQLNESLIALADEAELVNTLMNMSDQYSGSVCEPYGRAGGIYMYIHVQYNDNSKL